MMEDGQRDKPRKPEEHGHGIKAKDGPFVGITRESSRGEEEERRDQKGPDRSEDEEVDARRGVSV